MNAVQIFQTILAIAPTGLQLTQEVLSLVLAMEAMFKAVPGTSTTQAAAVNAVAAHLST